MPSLTDNTAKWGVRKLTKFQENSGIPVGFEYFSTNPNIPAGSIPLFGGEYSREVYSDLWSWVQEQAGYLIEESEWQEKSAANGGNVPFYSTGDGVSTFRVPSLKCWVKGANGIEEVGSYLSAGLPNITGNLTRATLSMYDTVTSKAGALDYTTNSGVNGYARNTGGTYNLPNSLSFDASKSNAIYGNSDTVQPKSIVGMWLVKAYGTVTNVGNLDIGDIEHGLTEVETRINIINPTGTVLPFSGNNVPQGYLPCNGSAISRTTYADLFAVIGTLYGAGDGSTTFNLPNLTDKFIQGNNTAGTVKSAGLPNITGSTFNSGYGGYIDKSGLSTSGALIMVEGASNTSLNPGEQKRYYLQFDASKSNTIYGNSTTVQPPAITMRYIIKY